MAIGTRSLAKLESIFALILGQIAALPAMSRFLGICPRIIYPCCHFFGGWLSALAGRALLTFS